MENLSIARHRELRTTHHLFNGYNDNVSAGSVPETVWSGGGLIAWPTTAAPIVAVSSSASDTDTLVIQGLNANYQDIEETITLAGLTPVSSAQNFLRVNSATYSTTNIGSITGTISAAPILHISVGAVKQRSCAYTVPLGARAYLTSYIVSVQKAKDARFSVLVRPQGSVFREAHGIEVFESVFDFDFHIPYELLARTDIEIRTVAAETANTRVHASMEFILIYD